MMYSNPKSVLEQKLNETLSTPEESIISDLMKLALLKEARYDSDLLVYDEMFKLLGMENFMRLVSLLDGRTVTFPKQEDMKQALTTCICYYYKEILGKDWSDIKAILGDTNMNTIKEGIHNSQYSAFLKEIMGKMNK